LISVTMKAVNRAKTTKTLHDGVGTSDAHEYLIQDVHGV